MTEWTFVANGRDVNYSFNREARMSLISFPYPAMNSRCPREYNVIVQLGDESELNWDSALGVWRRVPKYLGRAHGGHLVVFVKTEREISLELMQCLGFRTCPVGETIESHELCEWKYSLG